MLFFYQQADFVATLGAGVVLVCSDVLERFPITLSTFFNSLLLGFLIPKSAFPLEATLSVFFLTVFFTGFFFSATLVVVFLTVVALALTGFFTEGFFVSFFATGFFTLEAVVFLTGLFFFCSVLFFFDVVFAVAFFGELAALPTSFFLYFFCFFIYHKVLLKDSLSSFSQSKKIIPQTYFKYQSRNLLLYVGGIK